jgi:murein DD-endopeptidase MepM/ murein hydrolase activator NlpD
MPQVSRGVPNDAPESPPLKHPSEVGHRLKRRHNKRARGSRARPPVFARTLCRICADFVAPANAGRGRPYGRRVRIIHAQIDPAIADSAVRSTSATVLRRVLSAAALAVAFAVVLEAPAPADSARSWLRPVPGDVVRPFDYTRERAFVAGAHRGVDLAAESGATVRAACAGDVVHARPVARRGKVVTVRCGAYRVTYLPLATVRAHAGTRIARRAPIGTVGPGHGGLHVGVRRAGDRFAYEDPLSRFGADDRLPPPVAVRGTRIRATRPPAAVLRPVRPVSVERHEAGRVAPPTPTGSAAPDRVPALRPPADIAVLMRPRRDWTAGPNPLAPWPVWAGAAVVLAGCAGSWTVGLRARRRRAAAGPVVVPAREASG